MEPVRVPLQQMLADLKPSVTELPYVSTVTGTALDGVELDADYWWDNIRQPVRLDRAMETLASEQTCLYLEVGPHPILQGYVQENLSTTGRRGRPLPTLKKDDDGEERLTETVLTSHVLGASLDTKKLFPHRGHCVSLPCYAWQRENHWHQPTDEVTRLLKPRGEHPLLGFSVPHVERTWENQIDTGRFPYLADHVVGGAVVFPASGFVEMALAAAAECPTTDNGVVEALEIRAPLVLNGQPKIVRFSLTDDDHRFTIRSRPRFSDDKWTLNVVGRLASYQPPSEAGSRLSTVSDDDASSMGAEQHYRLATDVGLRYGPMFRAVSELRLLDEIRVRARIEPPVVLDSERDAYHIHPVVLDACLQSLLGALIGHSDRHRPVAYLPQRLTRIRLLGDGDSIRCCEVVIKRRSDRSVVADFELADASGNVVARMEGFRFRRMPLTADGAADPSLFQFRAILESSMEQRNRAPLPQPSVLAASAVPVLERKWQTLRRAEYYEQYVPLLDALMSAYALDALHTLGVGEHPFTPEGLAGSAGIPGSQLRLLRRLLEMLREDGIALPRDGQWAVTGSIELPDAASIWRRLLADFPAYVSELTVVGRCGMHLADILRGRMEPGNLLSPARGVGAVEHMHRTSPTARVTRGAVRAVVKEIVRGWPSNRRLRILQVVDEAGGVAHDLLCALPDGQCDYVIAASEPEARARWATTFAEFPYVSVIELDVTGDLVEQAAPRDPFDVVITSCAHHSPAGVPVMLENIRRLLATGGTLLLQGRRRDRLTDFVFGVNPQWWDRPDGEHGRAGASISWWCDALTAGGLADITPITEPVAVEDATGYMLIARNPSRCPGLVTTATDELRSIMLVGDGSGDSCEVCDRIAESLLVLGHQVVNVRIGETFTRLAADRYEVAPQPDSMARLCETLASDDRMCAEVIQLSGFGMRDDLVDADPMTVQERRCATTVHLVQGILNSAWSNTPRLWLVTCRAMVPECGCQDFLRQIPTQSPLWGLGRVLMNEHPELRCRLVDLHIAEDPVVAAQRIVGELQAPDDEDEVILTSDRRYAMRAWRVAAGELTPENLPTASGEDTEIVQLDNPASGFDQFIWQRSERAALGAGEVAIRTRATGLNFRDVMLSMGMLPDEAVENGFAGSKLGMECAGDVAAVGAGVEDLEPGDPVVCFAPSSFASHLVTKETAVAPMPVEWSYEEAASVPVAFFTAYYALHHLGKLRVGDRVLIHGAAGGVGLAALQYARHCGAEPFVTAGSEEKRDFLRLLGVEHVMDSRSLLFADEIVAITEGEGVDVVLNSLSGEAVSRNLEVLRPFGRLLELGKRDYYEDARIGLRPFRNNIAYFGIDVDQLFKERPELAGRLLREMMDLFAAGVFRPLPHRVFSAARVADAFRHMQQSRHIGKVVVSFDHQPTRVRTPKHAHVEFTLRPDVTYVIAGGLGGFGLATARWMAARGARYLALMGRTGATGSEARETVAELEAAGVTVHVSSTDICDAGSLSKNLDRETLTRVLEPKVRGAWNLHRQSLGMSLDFFVLYSSATTSVGNPGQANYVAANVYLESLASYRRCAGLPGLAIAWGPIEDVGYLARNQDTKDALTSRLGGRALTSSQVFRTLERLMLAERSGLSVVNLDWSRVARALPAARAPKFSLLTSGLDDATGDAGLGDDIQNLIEGMSEDQIRELTTRILQEQVARVVHMSPDQVDVEQSVFELGMDSLMAVELQVAIEAQFGVSIPAMAMNEDTSIVDLAGRITRQLEGKNSSEEDGKPASERDILASLSARHGEGLTAEELEIFADDVAEVRREEP
jgi:NADPH:quinone reductase-like Zn-dependent oxidoreductase/acyl carrier protein/SAM-dependent methyltransferase